MIRTEKMDVRLQAFKMSSKASQAEVRQKFSTIVRERRRENKVYLELYFNLFNKETKPVHTKRTFKT
jgi:hypothetical protein